MGLNCKPGNTRDLADKIIALCQDPAMCQRRFAFDPPTAGMELTHPDGMTASVTNRVSIGVRLHLRSGCGWGAKDPGVFLFP